MRVMRVAAAVRRAAASAASAASTASSAADRAATRTGRPKETELYARAFAVMRTDTTPPAGMPRGVGGSTRLVSPS